MNDCVNNRVYILIDLEEHTVHVICIISGEFMISLIHYTYITELASLTIMFMD